MKSKDHPAVSQSPDVVRSTTCSIENLSEASCTPNCSIARDLMPLRLENLCREASTSFVDRHVAACEPCAAIYDELRTAPPMPVSSEQIDSSFSEAFRQMLRTIHLRNVLLVLVGMLLGLALLFVGDLTYRKLCNDAEKPIPLSAVTLSLRRLANGAVLMITDINPKYHLRGVQSQQTNVLSTSSVPSLEDPIIVYFQPRTTYIELPWQETPLARSTWYHEMHFRDGVLYEGAFEAAPDKSYGAVWNAYVTEILEVRLGTLDGESILIYQQGDDIPLCTPEEEAELERAMSININGEYDYWAIPRYSFPDDELRVTPEP